MSFLLIPTEKFHSWRRALRKNLQAVYCQELPQMFATEEENQRGPKRDIQKRSI